MPACAHGRYDVQTSRPNGPDIEQLRRIEVLARRDCGARRVFGALSMAKTQDLFFAHLRGPQGQSLDPSKCCDIRFVLAAIAYWRDVIGAVTPCGSGFVIRDFQLGSELGGWLGPKDMAAEKRRLLRTKSRAARARRLAKSAEATAIAPRKMAIPGDMSNVAPYRFRGLTPLENPGTPRSTSGRRTQAHPSLPPIATFKLSDAGAIVIGQINLVEQKTKEFNRQRLSRRHARNLRREASLSAFAAVQVPGIAEAVSVQRFAPPVGGSTEAPDVASALKAFEPPLRDDVKIANTDSLGGVESLQEGIARLERLAAAEDAQMASGMGDGLTQAQYTQQEHDRDFGGIHAKLRQTPIHGARPTVPVQPGLPITPAFMVAFRQRYPQYAAMRPAVLMREGLTQGHLWAAAANTQHAKTQRRSPGLVVHGARKMRDMMWGMRV